MPRFNTIKLLLITLGVAALAGQAEAAKLYKWVDSEGNVQYTQTPPTEGEEVTVITPKLPATKTEEEEEELTPEEKQKAAEEEVKKKLEEGKPEQAKGGEDEAKRKQMEQAKKLCDTAQQNLKSYQSGAKRMMIDGEAVVVTEEERERRIEMNQKLIDEYCH